MPTKPLLAALPLLLLLASCHYNTETPTGQAGLAVDGREILVETELWRDFFPPVEPDGRPLFVYVRLWAPDSLPLPLGFAATRAWVTYGREVWETGLADDQSWNPPYADGWYAGGGPKWGPGATVDVTVHVIQTGGKAWDVFIPGCVIGRCE